MSEPNLSSGRLSVEEFCTNPPRPYVITTSLDDGSKPVLWAHPDRRELVFANDAVRELILSAPETKRELEELKRELEELRKHAEANERLLRFLMGK